MTGIEIVTAASIIVNTLGAIASLFGWKKYQEKKQTIENVQGTLEAVVKGVEAGSKILKSDEAKVVKQSIAEIAVTTGAESSLHKLLVKLGFSKE